MAKFANDDVLDGLLNVVVDNSSKLVVCSSQPTNYTEATTTYALAEVSVDSGDFTIANGDSSGRKVTIAQQDDLSIDVSGTAEHIALVDDTNSELLFVTTCTSQALTSANTVTVPAWKIEVSDPS